MRLIILFALILLATAAMAEDRGKQIFETRCAMCHQLPDTAALTPKQWRLVLMTMQKRMEQNGLPPLSEEEFDLVLDYVSKQVEQ